MAKTTLEIDNKKIEVSFDLVDSEGEIKALNSARYASSGLRVDLNRRNMRGKILDALNCILSQESEDVEFDDGENPGEMYEDGDGLIQYEDPDAY